MKSITIDRSRPLREQPKTGHNRWHPDIPPAIEVDEGEEVALETRDATDGYLHPKSTVSDLAGLPAGGIHPLTGPVLVKGARPGDLLEVEFVDIVGVSGVAPSRQQVDAWTKREGELMARGGMVFPPDAGGAVPAAGPAASQGMRTLPP